MSFPTEIHGTFGADKVTYNAEVFPVGTKLVLPDGRAFRFGEAVADTVAGRLYQSEATTANWNNENLTVAGAIGDITVTVDVATTPAVDDFKGGFLVNETSGVTYAIKSNTAADPTVLTLYEPLKEAIPTADVVSLFKSPYRDVVIKVAADATAPAIGVAAMDADISVVGAFQWFQTYGLCGVLVEDTLVVGDIAVASPVADAGAVAAAADATNQEVGWVLEIGANTEIGTVFLVID